MRTTRQIRLLGSSLQHTLNRLCKKHGVCGASLAILADGVIHTATSGWANAPERIEVTPTTVFQIGSIGKTFTATLAMQLAEEGLLDLDAPVRRYLPDFSTADPRSPDVTIRQLLTHTSGMDGDFIPPGDPFDRGAEEYLGKVHKLGQLHAPGEYMVYCNSGYVVLTRVIEVLRKTSWNDLVTARICKPLGLTHAMAHPKESLRFRMATGHVLDKKGNWMLALVTYLQPSMAGAGSVLSMSASDLVRYAAAHMTGPARRSTKRSILSQASFRSMQTPQVKMPAHSRKVYTHMGLSWFLHPHEQYPKFNHDGTTQLSSLHVLPKQRLAYALLINCLNTTIGDEVRRAIFHEIAGLPAEPAPVVPPPIRMDAKRFVGFYPGLELTATVTAARLGHLRVKIRTPSQTKVSSMTLRAVGPDEFAILDEPHVNLGARVLFLGDENGRAKYYRWGVRMNRRADQ